MNSSCKNINFNNIDKNKKILVTGAAGFIGFHLSKALLKNGIKVCGYDNLNDYYDVSLKKARLDILREYDGFEFHKNDLCDMESLEKLFKKEKFDIVVNLAARAGVRNSITNPRAFVESNIVGFFNILECCRNYPVKHLIFASSSSVYGDNKKVPFSVEDKVDSPVSLYAATKKSDELMAYAYSNLYNIKTTGLRFFTVYGPYGRPDMAYFKFTKNIFEGKPIDIYNNGDMYRDFTYIDDIVNGMLSIICNKSLINDNNVYYKIHNIGNNKTVKLLDFIKTIEKHVGNLAYKNFLPMQQADVYKTYANIDDMIKDYGFKPSFDIDKGIFEFVKWYKNYYNVHN